MAFLSLAVVFLGSAASAATPGEPYDDQVYPQIGPPATSWPPGPESPWYADADTTLTDDGGTIDVMVVYTPQARINRGGTAAMEAAIADGIALANTAYANSGITTRLRLVHAAEVSYTETYNSGTDLSRLQKSNDGYADEIHTWRNQYGADLVSMLLSSLDSGVAGRAYVMSYVHGSFASYAFSVVHQNYVDSFTFPHELGHNMGASHDHDNGSVGAYPYSFGYRVPGEFRTVMSYPCYYQGLAYCQQQPYFSNPAVLFNGMPTGVDDWADNARTFNETAWTVANFRQSVSATANTPPIVAAGPDASIVAGTALTQSGSFTDTGPSPWSATVNYGDGSGTQGLSLSGSSFTLSHVLRDGGQLHGARCV
jgi:peptidyl-Asp metalloendopeptidase